MDVPSKEGLTMQLEVSVLYHLDPEKAQEVYRTVGEEFVPVLLEPQFRSVTRGVTAAYDAKALYTSEREQLGQVIASDLRKLVERPGHRHRGHADAQADAAPAPARGLSKRSSAPSRKASVCSSSS